MLETLGRRAEPVSAWAARLAPGAALTARVGALLAVAVSLEVLFVRVTTLPARSHDAHVLALQVVRRIAWPAQPASLIALACLVAGAVAAFRHRSAGPRWTDVEHGTRLRWLALVLATMLAWAYSTPSINFYFGRAHGVDRLLVVASVALVWWRPLAVLPFLAVLLPLAGQSAHPIGGFSWAAPILPIRVLFTLAAFWLLRCATRRVATADAAFLLCCLVAAHYWVSGVEKVRLDWVFDDRVALLLPATYAQGWLAFLHPATIERVTVALGHFNAPMRIGTFVLECGALLALSHRTVLRGLLTGWIGLHAAIFLLSGILFWEWMILDATLLLVLFGRTAPAWPIFSRSHAVLALLLIGGGALWFRPFPLAWLDAPVNYAFRVSAEGAGGRTYDLPPSFFGAYAFQFTLSGFGYLDDHPRLPISWGATGDRRTIEALGATPDAARVLEAEARLGRAAFDPARAATFDAFVERFIDNWNARGGERGWWTAVAAPPLLWTFARRDVPPRGERITRVSIHEVTAVFDGTRYREIRTHPVRVIDIPSQPATDR